MADPILGKLRRKIRRERADERAGHRKASIAKRRIAFLQAAVARRVARRHGLDREAVLDGTPMPLGVKLVLLDARQEGHWPGVATSCDRRSAPPAVVRLIHRLGKKTQAELWYGWSHRLPGYLPANQPPYGSHMEVGDGVVGARGEKLPWWRIGIDTTYATDLRLVLTQQGYGVTRPYATASEEHHSNLTEDPKRRLVERGRV